MKITTINIGIILFIIGVLMLFLNYFTYTYYNIDIDIFGAIIAVIGIVLSIIGYTKK